MMIENSSSLFTSCLNMIEKDRAKTNKDERQSSKKRFGRIAAAKARDERFKKSEEKEEEKNHSNRRFLEVERFNRGNKIDIWTVHADFIFQNFTDRVTALSCANGATIMLYENGGWSWTIGIPKYLHNKLNGRQKTLPVPTYVAIGSMGRYYIEFSDGQVEYVACDEMKQTLEKCRTKIKSIAFGVSWNSFAIVYIDGCFHTLNVPYGLDNLIRSRRNKTDLDCISLGPAGEWYMSAKNRKAWWDGLTTQTMNKIQKYKNQIKFLDFPGNDGYILRYS